MQTALQTLPVIPSIPQSNGNGYVPVPDEPIWPLSVSQYHAMIKAGILDDDTPVELLEGWLVYKMPKNAEHIFTLQETGDILKEIVPSGWYVNLQDSVTLETSEPEPDIVVLRGSRREYRRQKPTPQDVSLIIEVADSTLGRDRGRKRRMYARAGIPIYWIINLVDSQIEVYQLPSGVGQAADYQEQLIFGSQEQIPVILDGVEIGNFAVTDILS